MAESHDVMTKFTSHAVTEPHLVIASGGVITAEYGNPGEASYRRVIVNLSAGTITFFRCHTPSRFMATGPDAECSFRLDEIRGICSTWVHPRDVGPVLDVVTSTGRARLPQSMSGFKAVHEAIEQTVAKSGSRLRWYEAAAAQEVFVLTSGAALAAGVIWALPEMSRGAIAATAGTMVLVLLSVCGWYWWRKRTWW
jgi:hypothetical protein